jgi:hypothetical protein
MNGMIKDPILTTVAFGNLQMLGGKSVYWITEHMRLWLEQLGKKER